MSQKALALTQAYIVIMKDYLLKPVERPSFHAVSQNVELKMTIKQYLVRHNKVSLFKHSLTEREIVSCA